MRPSDTDKILCEELSYLERECDADQLVAFMFSKRVFSDVDLEEVRAGRTRSEKNQKFFEILRYRGSRAFPVFLQALRGHGQDHVASRLEQRQSPLEICDMYDGRKRTPRERMEQKMAQVEAKVDDLDDRVALLEDEKLINQLKEDLKRAQLSAEDTRKKLLRTEKDNAKKQNEIDRLRKELSSANERIKKIEARLKRKEKENAELRARVEEHSRQLQEQTREIEELKENSLSSQELVQIKAMLAFGRSEPSTPREASPPEREDPQPRRVVGQADVPHPMAATAGRGDLAAFANKDKKPRR